MTTLPDRFPVRILPSQPGCRPAPICCRLRVPGKRGCLPLFSGAGGRSAQQGALALRSGAHGDRCKTPSVIARPRCTTHRCEREKHAMALGLSAHRVRAVLKVDQDRGGLVPHRAELAMAPPVALCSRPPGSTTDSDKPQRMIRPHTLRHDSFNVEVATSCHSARRNDRGVDVSITVRHIGARFHAPRSGSTVHRSSEGLSIAALYGPALHR